MEETGQLDKFRRWTLLLLRHNGGVTMSDPPLEPSALTVIRAFRPAVHLLEKQTFASDRERIAYVGLLRKVTMDGHAARALAESSSTGVMIASHSPVAVLSRSVVESAGQFARWFLNGMPAEQREFELLAAFLAGELGRLEHIPQTSGYEDRIQEVRDLVTNLTAQVGQHPYWNTLSPKARKSVQEGRWKFVDKNALPAELGYGPQTLAGLYSWMSDATHGGTRLLQQMTQENPDVQRFMRSSLNFVAASLALLLQRLAEQEPEVQAFLTSHLDVQHAVGLQTHIALT